MIQLKDFKSFTLKKNKMAIPEFLENVGKEYKKAFSRGLRARKSGRKYGSHTASAAGEFPATRSGKLAASVDYVVKGDTLEVGTNTPYSGYLKTGTRNMAKRKMSAEALKNGLRNANRKFGRWMEFKSE